VESLSLCELGIAYMEAAKARESSCPELNFFRHDYPESSEEWHAWVAIAKGEAEVLSRKVPVDYHLQEPYASDLEENYQRFAEI
jgi:hypothetical protein